MFNPTVFIIILFLNCSLISAKDPCINAKVDSILWPNEKDTIFIFNDDSFGSFSLETSKFNGSMKKITEVWNEIEGSVGSSTYMDKMKQKPIVIFTKESKYWFYETDGKYGSRQKLIETGTIDFGEAAEVAKMKVHSFISPSLSSYLKNIRFIAVCINGGPYFCFYEHNSTDNIIRILTEKKDPDYKCYNVTAFNEKVNKCGAVAAQNINGKLFIILVIEKKVTKFQFYVQGFKLAEKQTFDIDVDIYRCRKAPFNKTAIETILTAIAVIILFIVIVIVDTVFCRFPQKRKKAKMNIS